nr:glucokinase [Stenotrophomonas mori]
MVADIGGTTARFALARAAAPAALDLDLDSIGEYPVARFASLAEAAAHYLAERRARASHAVFAVAGRVADGRAHITNHPWVIEHSHTAAQLGLERLELINDFVAQAMSIALLRGDDVVAVGPAGWQPAPAAVPRNYCVIGPGTGLGVAGLVVRDGRYHPLATEGGHASFAPTTSEQVRLLDVLAAQFGRVSNERLVCGPGLVNVYRALGTLAGHDPGPLQPAQVSERAAAGEALAVRALAVFMEVFGAVAGDAVLVQGAWDGVFLTGGLVPRLLGPLQRSAFRRCFENKGRFSAALSTVPSLAIVHPCPGLLGAAAHALHPAPRPTGATA